MNKITFLVFSLSFLSAMANIRRQFSVVQEAGRRHTSHEYTAPFKNTLTPRFRSVDISPTAQYQFPHDPHTSHETLPHDHTFRQQRQLPTSFRLRGNDNLNIARARRIFRVRDMFNIF
ncbi:unnamed protein product [Meganyctiphanes norvegica]|uniref:Uncharacterized protein n=1 Tax=Meganyctiphanes norvegica TaxID=48144 RepID=A0AAV2Q789_MEGNR